MIYILFSILIITCLVGIAFGQNNADDTFSIYLLPDNIKTKDLSKLDLSKIKLPNKPFLEDDDIEAYNKDTYQLIIRFYKQEVREKVKKLNLTKEGRPFVVAVGKKPIYTGVFYELYMFGSTQNSTDVVVFAVPANDGLHFWTFNLGDPYGKKFVGKDLRNDPRILKAFQAKGKLVEDLEIIGRCKEIKDIANPAATEFTFEVASVTRGKLSEKEIKLKVGSSPNYEENILLKFFESHEIDKERRFRLYLEKVVGSPKTTVSLKQMYEDFPVFAIYLLPAPIKTKDLANLDLSKIKLRGKPLIDQEDIGFYNKTHHDFVIFRSDAQEKIKKLNIPTSGLPFVVAVDKIPIYAGAFYTNLSSQSFNGITIIPYTEFYYQRLRINLGYPSEKFFTGKDLRSDARIMKAFQIRKELFEDLEIVARCKEVKGTGKRNMSVIFTFEVLSVMKGKFDEKEMKFELTADVTGGMNKLMDMCLPDRKNWEVVTEKPLLLKFEGDYFKDVSEYQE